MLGNYRYRNHFSEAAPLMNEYRYSEQRFEMQLPLPGYSIKMPFEEKPVRFLNVNRRNKEIDHLRDHILHKCSMEQMHYQAKIQQMRRENEVNRMKLEKLLSEQHSHLFQIPDRMLADAKSLGSNLDKIAHERELKRRNRVQNSVDKAKSMNNGQGIHDSSEDSENSEEEAQRRKQRQRDLDYIYKKNGAVNTSAHMGTMPIIKTQEQKRLEKMKEKKEQNDWIEKVRNARAKIFIEQDKASVDSSVASESSEQKNRKKQQEQRKQKQKKIQQNEQKSRMSRMSGKRQSAAPKAISQHNKKTENMSKISEISSEGEQNLSSMSKFSRYAQKNRFFKQEGPAKKNQLEIISEALAQSKNYVSARLPRQTAKQTPVKQQKQLTPVKQLSVKQQLMSVKQQKQTPVQQKKQVESPRKEAQTKPRNETPLMPRNKGEGVPTKPKTDRLTKQEDDEAEPPPLLQRRRERGNWRN